MSTEWARKFLGHEKDSGTFETSYDQGVLAMDAFAIAMGRKPDIQGTLIEGEY